MKVLSKLDSKNVIFFDIETVPLVETLKPDTPLWDAWCYKLARDGNPDADPVKTFSEKAALYPEFAKIVCISVGYITKKGLYIKSFSSHDEVEILEGFNELLEQIIENRKKPVLCGQAIIGFDVPFIFRRCLINEVLPHPFLDTSDKKPWELLDSMIDTNVLWKGTGFNGASLLAIATALGLPSPKDDISGADVGKVYYSEGDEGLKRITTYCEKDVLTVANVFRKCRFEPIMELASVGDTDEDNLSKDPLIIDLFNGGKFGKAEQDKLIVLYNTAVDKKAAKLIIDALVSNAKGKTTKVTKEWVKENLK